MPLALLIPLLLVLALGFVFGEHWVGLGLAALLIYLARALTTLKERVQRLETKITTLTALGAAAEAAKPGRPVVEPAAFASQNSSETAPEPLAEDADAAPAHAADATAEEPVYAAWPEPQPVEVHKPVQPPARHFDYARYVPLWNLNPVAKAGIAILLIGVVLLARYAIANAMFPLPLRLASLALGAVALLMVGWRLRSKRSQYAQLLQGAGIATLYLTCFASSRLYHLIPMSAALPFMVLVCAGSTLMALLQGAQPLAVIGFAGGFLAPVLLAEASHTPVPLFAYYALLNAGVLALAASSPGGWWPGSARWLLLASPAPGS